MNRAGGGGRAGKVLRVVTLTLAALALLYVLASRAHLTPAAIARPLAHLAWWSYPAIVALLTVNLALATVKWLLVMRTLDADDTAHPRFADALLATTFGALLGQVMPFQVGVALSRSMAGRLGVGRSAGANFGTTVYEQAFDAVATGAAAVAAVPGIFLHLRLWGWMALAVSWGLLVVGGSLLLPLLLGVVAGLLRRLPPGRRIQGFAVRLGEAVRRAAAFRPRMLAWLALLSMLRYAAGLALILALLAALGLFRYAAAVSLAFPFLQVVAFLPITPGNLGVMEWSWSAALVSGGATLGAGATFALAVRVVAIVALIVIVALMVCLHVFRTNAGWHQGGAARRSGTRTWRT